MIAVNARNAKAVYAATPATVTVRSARDAGAALEVKPTARKEHAAAVTPVIPEAVRVKNVKTAKNAIHAAHAAAVTPATAGVIN